MPRLVLVTGPTGAGKSTLAVQRSRASYEPLAEPKLVVDAVHPLAHNLDSVFDYLGVARAE